MIDVVEQVTSVRRQVGSRVLKAGEVRSVGISRVYDTTVEDLWEACTDPQRIPRWFLPVSGELRVGGRFQLEGNAGGTIESCDPPHGFTATWEFGGKTSWIELRLAAEDDSRTRFELEHLVPVDDHWEEFGPGAVGLGWDLGLLGLTLHLRTNETVDPGPVMEWMASEEGERLMTLAAEAWREADVAGGTDPAQAEAAASRTAVAYGAT